MTSDYKQLLEECKQYASMRYDLLRLELLEKISRIFSLLLLAMASITLVIIIFVYLSVLLLIWLQDIFASMIPGVCIVAGMYTLLLICIIVFKDKVFLNPMVRALSKIIFSEENKNVEPVKQ